MKINSFVIIMGFLHFSCSNYTKSVELTEFPVDTEQGESLPLSEITDTINAIELELTDESLINPDRIKRIFLCDNNVIVSDRDNILVFGTDGKFIRKIGSKGQGPGEYTGIRNLAIDESNKHLYLNAQSKFICYDWDGTCLKESTPFQQGNISVTDMNYINNELLLVVEQAGKEDERGLFNYSAVYWLNDELQIIDSCTIRVNYFERPGLFIHPYENFILNGNSTVYLYYSELYYADQQKPSETVLRDTLYRLEENHLVPELKLKFKDNGIDGSGNKFIELMNINRSSRYVFAVYSMENNFYHFCYDTKTGKGYNMKEGYMDDINQIEKPVSIRPFNLDTEMFYYLYTHMKPDDLEEPNPTLYIGRLKK